MVSSTTPHLRPLLQALTWKAAAFPLYPPRLLSRTRCTPRPNCIRNYADGQGKRSTLDTLRRVAELQKRVAAENSQVKKRLIIAEYPDLRELLEYVYKPDHRMHLSSRSLRKHLAASPVSSSVEPAPAAAEDQPGLIELFEKLSTRHIMGNDAKEIVVRYLSTAGVLGDEQLYVTFGRLLDRNLVAGFGAKALREVRWPSSTDTAGGKSKKLKSVKALSSSQPPKVASAPSAKPTSGITKTPLHPNVSDLDNFQVALGKSLEPPFDGLFKGGAKWYASRKLDGVRCLTFLDFLAPSTPNTDLEIASIHFVSRTGKPFSSLARLEEQLVHLARLPGLREWLDDDPSVVEQRDNGAVKRLVLDGEVCVMRPKTGAELENAQPRDDGSVADEMWTAKDPFIEDFSSTVSAMRRSTTIEHLSYFVFDVLSLAEVDAKGSLPQAKGLGKKFGQRIDDIRHLGGWLNAHLDELGVEGKMVKDLKQVKVGGVEDVEKMVQRAAEEGWEGIVLRRDEGYKGTRSPDIRKFKKWQDGEYLVHSLDVNKMRLSINGVFDEYEALANVWIEHEGHRVSVGSGFTAEQRIRYARHPDEIVGKTITVEYFSESEAVNRKGGGKSLRFPRIKMVWEEGKRGM